mmetsp:Transcript_61395/g.181495  ORF Transcript_61395/g.181495 Transcript_61395/m.181495 type:complete len:207 (-) Transcript_61395:140-760(-)
MRGEERRREQRRGISGQIRTQILLGRYVRGDRRPTGGVVFLVLRMGRVGPFLDGAGAGQGSARSRPRDRQRRDSLRRVRRGLERHHRVRLLGGGRRTGPEALRGAAEGGGCRSRRREGFALRGGVVRCRAGQGDAGRHLHRREGLLRSSRARVREGGISRRRLRLREQRRSAGRFVRCVLSLRLGNHTRRKSCVCAGWRGDDRSRL